MSTFWQWVTPQAALEYLKGRSKTRVVDILRDSPPGVAPGFKKSVGANGPDAAWRRRSRAHRLGMKPKMPENWSEFTDLELPPILSNQLCDRYKAVLNEFAFKWKYCGRKGGSPGPRAMKDCPWWIDISCSSDFSGWPGEGLRSLHTQSKPFSMSVMRCLSSNDGHSVLGFPTREIMYDKLHLKPTALKDLQGESVFLGSLGLLMGGVHLNKCLPHWQPYPEGSTDTPPVPPDASHFGPAAAPQALATCGR